MHSIKKRILSLTAAALSVVGMASGAMAIESNKDARPIMSQIDVTGYNANVDYTAEMLKCIERRQRLRYGNGRHLRGTAKT